MSDRSIGDFSRLVRQDPEEAARRLKAGLPREVLLDFIHALDSVAGPIPCGNPDPDPRMEGCHAEWGHDGPHRHSGKIVHESIPVVAVAHVRASADATGTVTFRLGDDERTVWERLPSASTPPRP